MIKTTSVITRPNTEISFHPPGYDIGLRIAPHSVITYSEDGLTCTIVDYWHKLSDKYRRMNNEDWLERYEARLRWFSLNGIELKSRSEIVLQTERDLLGF